MNPSRLLTCLTVFSISVAAIGKHESSGFPRPRILDGNTMPPKNQESSSLIDRYEEYLAYLKKFEKKYDTVEELNKHFRIYCENLQKIQEHNRANSSYKQGVNKFTDISDQEFQKDYVMHIDLKKLTKVYSDKKPESDTK